MDVIPTRILTAMENTHRDLNELELRLRAAMDDSTELPASPQLEEMKNSPCDKCRELRSSKSPRKRSSKRDNCENLCPSCDDLGRRLEFMNDEMNRLCESEAKLKESLEVLGMDYELAQQELSIANARIDGKVRTANENEGQIDNLRSQLLANSADRISSLQFELERKVDELQKLGEEHKYLLTLHYNRPSSSRRSSQQRQPTRGSEFMDISAKESQESLDQNLKAISELKLQLHENQKQLEDKDSKLKEKETDLKELNEKYAKLEEQLKMYMEQFERLQAVVAEYKEREDVSYSRGIQNSDIEQLEEAFPFTIDEVESRPREANGDHHEDPPEAVLPSVPGMDEDFFQELDEISNRLEETRRMSLDFRSDLPIDSSRRMSLDFRADQPMDSIRRMSLDFRADAAMVSTRRMSLDSTRIESQTPRKKCVSFAMADYESTEDEETFEITREEPLNQSKFAQIALLEQRSRAFELRAENLNQELENVRASLVDVREARNELTELVQVQQERISMFIEENAGLKSRLDRSVQESLDETSEFQRREMMGIHQKEQRLQTMIADIEVRNCTIQDMARSMNGSRLEVTGSDVGTVECSAMTGQDNSVADEIEGLRSRLNEINRENELLNDKIDKADNVIDALRKQVVSLQDPNSTNEQHTFNRSYADNSQLDYAKHENEMLHEKLELVQGNLAESEAEVREKEKQLTHLRQTVQTKTERIREVEEDLEKREVKISSYVAMIKKMKETKNEGKNEEGRLLEEERVKWEEEKDRMEQERLSIEEEKKKLERELNFAKLRYNELKGQMEDVENEYENLTNELAQVHDVKSTVQSQLSVSTNLNEELRSRVQNLEREIAVRNVESQNAKSAKWALESQISDLKEQVQELESKLTTGKDEEEDNDLKEELRYLKECVDETMDRLTEADAEKLKMNNELDEAKDQVLSLEKDILLKDDRIEQLQAKADEIEDLRAQVHHSEDKRRLLEKVVSEKESYVTEMATQIQSFTEKNEVLEEELNTATKNVEVLQSALDSREKELELIHDEISVEKTEKASLIDQVRSLKEDLETARARPTLTVKSTPQKEPLLIDLSSPAKTATPRTYRIAKRTLTPAKRSLNLDNLAQKLYDPEEMLVDVSNPTSSVHQMSTSTLCFDLMEKSIVEVGPLEPISLNETVTSERQANAPSQISFINGLETFSTPYPKSSGDLGQEVKSLREDVGNKALDLMKQITGLESECDDFRKRCLKLEESNQSYQSLLQGSKESQKILEGRVLQLIQTNHDLQDKLKEKVDLCSHLTNQRDQLLNEFSNANSLVRKLNVLEAEKRELTALLQRLRVELNRIAGKNCQLNQEVNELNERLENVDEIESELDDYKQALAEVEIENTTLKADMDERIEQLTSQITQSKNETVQANARLVRVRHIEQEFDTLTAKYDQVLGENELMYDEVKTLRVSLQKLQDIEHDFTALHRRNTQICKELSDLENLVVDQEKLKQTNQELETKCENLCQALEETKIRAGKADYLAMELDKIRDQYEELLEAKSQNESAIEISFSQLENIDSHNKERLEQLHEDVRRATEAKFQLELDLHQALQCAKESDTKHHRISHQLARIVDERNLIVSRLNQVTKKLNEKELDTDDHREADDVITIG